MPGRELRDRLRERPVVRVRLAEGAVDAVGRLVRVVMPPATRTPWSMKNFFTDSISASSATSRSRCGLDVDLVDLELAAYAVPLGLQSSRLSECLDDGDGDVDRHQEIIVVALWGGGLGGVGRSGLCREAEECSSCEERLCSLG